MLANIFKIILFISLTYVVFKIVKDTPPKVRAACGVLLIAGLLAIEIWLRLSGSKPYFIITNGPDTPQLTIIRLNHLVDYEMMICDSFGVNKINLSPKRPWPSSVNSDGFPSVHEFSQAAIDSIHAEAKKAIFLIGDSYTYGCCADSGFSFASLMENTGKYGILNAGIPGTDVPQYKAVVNEYILTRRLKPDQVVICINGANDLDHHPDRKLTPGTPILFSTNAGGLYSFQGNPGEDTLFRSAKSAYKHIIDRYTIYGIMGDGFWTVLMGKSCLASRLIGAFKKDSSDNQSAVHLWPLGAPDPAYNTIKEIKRDCDSLNVPVLFVLLPGKRFVQNGKSVPIEDVVSIDPRLFTLSDYTSGSDDHPVNSGHKKIAAELDKLLGNK